MEDARDGFDIYTGFVVLPADLGGECSGGLLFSFWEYLWLDINPVWQTKISH